MSLQSDDLLHAIKDGDEARVEFLLAANSKVAAVRNAEGVSAVMLALYQGQSTIAQMLAARKERIDIFEAAALGQLESLKRMVSSDPMCLRATSADGFPALHLAAFFGRTDAVRFLLAAGAGSAARTTNQMDNTALHAAMVHQQFEAARVLLLYGAPVNAKQRGGYTALHAAAHRGNIDLVKLLLQFGADPALITDDGRTAKDFALEKNFLDVAEMLCK